MAIDHMQSDARSAERRITQAASTLRTDGSGPIDVLVLDLSRTGVRIATPAELHVGQEISIGLAGAGVTRAFVIWGRDGQYGCSFEAPIGSDEAAKAFSRAPIVMLGKQSARTRRLGENDLQELYRRHRFWALPLDAIVMMLIVTGVLIALLYLV